MSGLYKPGVGDLLDRLTVLTLKVLHGDEQDKPVAHFNEEAAVLWDQLLTLSPKAPLLVGKDALALQALNALIWDNEDRLRALRGVDLNTVHHADGLNIAYRSQLLNDRRADLVRRINFYTQTGVHAPEKVSS